MGVSCCVMDYYVDEKLRTTVTYAVKLYYSTRVCTTRVKGGNTEPGIRLSRGRREVIMTEVMMAGVSTARVIQY
jgi:hypothetical protein